MNQTKSIIFHLSHGPLSSLVAFNKFGVTCFPRRIADVEAMGFKIDRQRVVSKNRWGHRNDYNLYTMRKTNANMKLFTKLFPVKKPCK